MGRDFYEIYEESRAAFDEADEALGFKLSAVAFEGPDDELVKTANTQPAILVTSIAMLRAAERELGRPFEPLFCAGHSLGEYTALVASGVLPLGDAARIVRRRGALMQDAVPMGRGAMSAILGLGLDAVLGICREAASGEVCGPANVNAALQIVISGDAPAVERAGQLARERGASKVIPLKVSAPFHCELMRPVADELEREFESRRWGEPRFPIVANVDACAKSSADSIRNALYAQTYSPVLWSDAVSAMVESGVDAFLEFGPGSVLSGLIKRIAKGAVTASVSRVQDVARALSLIGGKGV
jgi:[acyl-carrier-protein] S-malonyltransferase